MHLLMETAIGDSQHYEVLSPENVDSVKKELSVITTRIEATKRKLVLERKLRDATQSINRLYPPKSGERSAGTSPSNTDGQRRPGSKESGSTATSRTDTEGGESAKKCEELATELWSLEKQEQDLRRILMEHTAGVLQMTHKGYLKKEAPDKDLKNGDETRNASHAPRISEEFGEQSQYRPYSRANGDVGEHLNLNNVVSTADLSQQHEFIIEVEAKVEELNSRLRDIILELKPRKEDLPDPARELAENPENPSEILWEQLDFLDQCLDAMRGLHGNATEALQNANLDAEEKLEVLNTQLFDIMTQTSQGDSTRYSPPPDASGSGLQDQLDYLEGGLRALERRVMRLAEEAHVSSTKLTNYQERAEQYVSVIGGLWDILTASETHTKQMDQNSGPYDDPSTDDFSLQAFSVKVQDLQARSIDLMNQKVVLTRQVQQQRELNEKRLPANDTRLDAMRAEIEQANQQLEARSVEAKENREKVAVLMAELEAARQAAMSLEEKRANEGNQAVKAAEEALGAEKEARRQAEDLAEQKVQRLLAELEENQDVAEQKIQRLMAELDENRATTHAMELNALTMKSDLEDKAQEVASLQASIKNLESEVVRLQTELTIAKAELDGAYGSRAQRAAETAADPALQKELDGLKTDNGTLQKQLDGLKADNRTLSAELANLKTSQVSRGSQGSGLEAQVRTLQQELSETIADYEAMTKASIEFEKEREQLESLVDTLRDRIEVLDSHLSEDKVQMLGTKSPGSSREAGGAGTTSTMVLKNEFKKMMRETRAENAKALRVSKMMLYPRN
jgi:chromosome segregation ATPase